MAARLREFYRNTVITELTEQFGYTNPMMVPKLEKIVVNMGVGDSIGDPRLLEGAAADLGQITGQKAALKAARKSISNFELRQGVKIGAMVTLRGDRMYEFADRLFSVAMPRIRDFRGVSPKGFDRFGNYTLGLKEQTIFPEIDMEKVAKIRGMNVTFVIRNSKSADESRELLRKLGMPFAR